MVYEGDLRMAHRRFRRADGGEASYDINLRPSGVSVLALTGDDQVVLALQFRPGPERVLYDLPSGFVDPGEEPAVAAARELAEETGYEGDMREVGRSTPDAYSTEVRHIFVATDCELTRQPDTDEDEDIEVVLVSLDQLRDLLRNDRLTTVDAAYLALDSLGLLCPGPDPASET
jgi:ADP-ribose pyrophosphatase